MRVQRSFFWIFISMYSPQVFADIPSGDDKTGCATASAIDLGYILFPIILLGLLFLQKKQKISD